MNTYPMMITHQAHLKNFLRKVTGFNFIFDFMSVFMFFVMFVFSASLSASEEGVANENKSNNLFHLSMKDLSELEIIVATGTTRKGVTVLESSVAITVVNASELSRQVPFGLADSLKSVPGFYVQESGGQTSNNVGVRGLPASKHFEFISVHEDGLPVSYDRYTVDAIQRYDTGIARFEATRGGTSGVLSPNGAGAIVNYITKKGQQDEGTITLAMTDYENYRADFYLGKPLTDEWLLALSGYFQTGNTPRNTGFNAERGGQIRAVLTRLLANGELRFTYKHIDESNSFVLPLPLYRDSNGTLTAIPAFDLHHGNTTSLDNAHTSILFADGSSTMSNANDGANVKADAFTLNVDYDFSEQWHFHHASRFTDFNRNFNGIWTGSAGAISIMDATNYLNDDIDFGGGYGTIGDFYLNNPATKRCFQYTRSKEVICQGDNNVEHIGDNGLVQILNALNEPIHRQQFISDSRITLKSAHNSLSFGLLSANVDHQRALQSSLFLSEVSSNNAKVIDIIALNTDGNVQAYLSDSGVIKHGQWRGNDDMQVRSYSFYLNDEFQFNEVLHIDAGLRYEKVEYKATSLTGLGERFVVAGALDDQGEDIDNVVANNYANREFGDGNKSSHTTNYSELAWTIGFNYLFTDKIAMYGRFAHGFQTPRADRISDIRIGELDTPLSVIDFTELGVRYGSESLITSMTLFNTQFDNLLTGGVGFDSLGSEILNEAQVNVIGVEFDIAWSPTPWLHIESQGIIQQAKLESFTNPSLHIWQGNQPARTPDQQLRITPTVKVTDSIDIFLSYHYLGVRYGDNDNIVEFPSCNLLDIGGFYALNDSLSLQLKAKNITNEVCYNEGNPRATSEENQLAYGFARPITGSTWILSMSYHF